MSVVFTTVTVDSIAMCADKQYTNMLTKEKNDEATKIEKWSHSLAVGYAGNFALVDEIKRCVKSIVFEKGIDRYTLEEIADLFAQGYYAFQDEYDVPSGIVGKVIVAGVLENGSMGAATIFMMDGVPDTEFYSATESPMTFIFAPEDMDEEGCNQLFGKAIKDTLRQKKLFYDIIESSHRKAVRYVAEKSEFVGYKTDFLMIKRQ